MNPFNAIHVYTMLPTRTTREGLRAIREALKPDTLSAQARGRDDKTNLCIAEATEVRWRIMTAIPESGKGDPTEFSVEQGSELVSVWR
jgi:hypothetical protein